jgi:hypothetical protein
MQIYIQTVSTYSAVDTMDTDSYSYGCDSYRITSAHGFFSSLMCQCQCTGGRRKENTEL